MVNRTLLRRMHDEILDAVKAVAAKHGASVEIGRIRFGDDYAVFPIRAAFAAEGVSPSQQDFEKYARLFGLEASDFGRSFIAAQGTEYTICGLNPSAPKYPVIAENGNGTKYKFNAAEVLRRLAAQAEPRRKARAKAALPKHGFKVK